MKIFTSYVKQKLRLRGLQYLPVNIATVLTEILQTVDESFLRKNGLKSNSKNTYVRVSHDTTSKTIPDITTSAIPTQYIETITDTTTNIDETVEYISGNANSTVFLPIITTPGRPSPPNSSNVIVKSTPGFFSTSSKYDTTPGTRFRTLFAKITKSLFRSKLEN